MRKIGEFFGLLYANLCILLMLSLGLLDEVFCLDKEYRAESQAEQEE